MARTTAFLGVLVASICIGNTAVQADDTKAIKEEVLRRIKIEPEKIDSAALAKAFDATFYKVKIRIQEGGGHSTTTLSMALSKGKFVNIEDTSTTRAMPVLTGIVKKGFVIKTDADAAAFEAALDALWPIRSFGSKKQPKEIKKAAGSWTFVRGAFFKDLKGFVVKANADGAIKSIDYSLRIKQ